MAWRSNRDPTSAISQFTIAVFAGFFVTLATALLGQIFHLPLERQIVVAIAALLFITGFPLIYTIRRLRRRRAKILAYLNRSHAGASELLPVGQGDGTCAEVSKILSSPGLVIS